MKKKVVFENKNWLVYTPEDFEAAAELQHKTKWCVSYLESCYNAYAKVCVAGYFIINKINFDDSYALALFKDNDYELVDVLCYRKYPFQIPNKHIPKGLIIRNYGKLKVPTYLLKKLFKLNKIN